MNRTRIEFLSFLTAFDRLMLELRRQTNYGPYSCKFLSGGRVLELDKKKAQRWSRSLTGVALYGGFLQFTAVSKLRNPPP